MNTELKSFCDRNVKEDLTSDMVHERYTKNKIKVTRFPAKMVTVKTSPQDGSNIWKAKARCCVCGIFEDEPCTGTIVQLSANVSAIKIINTAPIIQEIIEAGPAYSEVY